MSRYLGTWKPLPAQVDTWIPRYLLRTTVGTFAQGLRVPRLSAILPLESRVPGKVTP